MFYSGGNTAEGGVAILIKNKLVNNVIKVQYIKDCLMYVKMSLSNNSANLVDVLSSQLYILILDHDDTEV